VPAQSRGNLELGADTVNTGNQHRVLVPLELKETAEEADATQYLGAGGRAGVPGD